MLVSLMQKPDKRNRRLVQNLHIGFSVFEVNITLPQFSIQVWELLLFCHGYLWKDLKNWVRLNKKNYSSSLGSAIRVIIVDSVTLYKNE